MKAWRIDSHGGPEALKPVEVAEPRPKAYEVLIKVEAVGLNHLDVWVRKGVEGHQFPLPMIPGCDITGVIEAWGEGSEAVWASENLKVGSPVIVNPGVSCGRCEACLSGFDPLCKHYGILGETQNGGCTEKLVVPVANLIPRPAQISAAQAAALPIAYLTAWTMLNSKVKLQPGEVILIQAGGSGVSVAAIQIAKLLGATVITTVGSTEKIEKCRSIGADFVIPYREKPFRAEVRKILGSLGKKGCDVVVDHVGAETFQESIKCLTWGGRFVTCGATSGGQAQLDLKALFFKNLSIFGSTMGSKSDLIRVVNLVASGKITPVIDSVLPLQNLPEAFSKLESRNVFGKIVMKVS